MEQKGHSPTSSLSGGKLSYLCPLPWHSETKPSFTVWTQSEYENFYCFGCQSSNNIIHLVSFVEGITGKQAIEKLAEGMNFTFDDVEEALSQDYCSEDYYSKNISCEKDFTIDIATDLIGISTVCQSFLKSVNYDPKECDRIDKLWEIVDGSLMDFDFNKIEKIKLEVPNLILKYKEALLEQDTNKLRKIWSNKNDNE